MDLVSIILPIIQSGVDKVPLLASIVFVIGAVRIVMKPLMTLLETVVNLTPTPADNSFLKAVLASKVYKAIVFALDLLLSVKLPKAK